METGLILIEGNLYNKPVSQKKKSIHFTENNKLFCKINNYFS